MFFNPSTQHSCSPVSQVGTVTWHQIEIFFSYTLGNDHECKLSHDIVSIVASSRSHLCSLMAITYWGGEGGTHPKSGGWGNAAGQLKPLPSEFPFTHSCAYMTHKYLKGRSLFHASASQGRMEAYSFQSHLSA